jgi:RNA polymerase sigma factor (sigma-70 family)
LRARGSGEDSQRDDGAWSEAAGLIRGFARAALRTQEGLPWEDVDDIAQNVLLKLQSAEALSRLHSTASPAAYIAAMVRNAAHDSRRRLRKDQKRGAMPADEFTGGWRIEDEFVTPERAARLRRALNSLRPDERRLLELRYWDDFSIEEIAAMLDISYSATAVRFFRILTKLRAKLGATM